MWKLIALAFVQSALMVACQLLQKIALTRAGDFSWSWGWFYRFFANFYMIGSGVCFAATAFCWLYMLKRYPFSILSNAKPGLRDGNARSHALFPRTDSFDPLDRHCADYGGMCLDSPIR